MIHSAHATRCHWGKVGTAANRARGEWQVSRVCATLGGAEPALYHARRCLADVEVGRALRTGTCRSPTRRSREHTRSRGTRPRRSGSRDSRARWERRSPTRRIGSTSSRELATLPGGRATRPGEARGPRAGGGLGGVGCLCASAQGQLCSLLRCEPEAGGDHPGPERAPRGDRRRPLHRGGSVAVRFSWSCRVELDRGERRHLCPSLDSSPFLFSPCFSITSNLISRNFRHRS